MLRVVLKHTILNALEEIFYLFTICYIVTFSVCMAMSQFCFLKVNLKRDVCAFVYLEKAKRVGCSPCDEEFPKILDT